MDKPKILFVDDEKPLRDTLARWFKRDYECLTAPDGDAAIEQLKADPSIALMVTDVRMPGMDGVELMRKAKSLNPAMAVIMLTAYGSVELAVESMRAGGATDFFQKPITDMKTFEMRIAAALKTAKLEKEVASLKEQLNSELENFTGKSPAMEKIYQMIRKVAPTGANVLIEGPSGTGKELVAKALHNLSPRAKGPFVAVECAAYAPSVLEAELFGSVKGAYTDARDRAGCFEQANGGTLFLDEIGEIDATTQIKLLRAIQERVITRVGDTREIPVDFRLIAATNKNLAEMVKNGKFREDLFYRLNVIDIQMPALKDRKGDVALLAARFLKEFSAANGSVVTGIEPAAIKALEDYDWPGNVRQLRNVIEKMVVLAGGAKLTTEDLPLEISAATQPPDSFVTSQPHAETEAKSVPESLADAEKTTILKTIENCRGNETKAAEILGISRRTLHRKLKEWNMR